MTLELQNIIDNLGTYRHSEETRKKISENCKGKRKHYIVSEETRLKISMSKKGKLLGKRDKSMPLEYRKKISETKKGKPQSKEHKEKIGKMIQGRIWINNGEKSKMIYPEQLEEYQEQGYNLGRIKWKE